MIEIVCRSGLRIPCRISDRNLLNGFARSQRFSLFDMAVLMETGGHIEVGPHGWTVEDVCCCLGIPATGPGSAIRAGIVQV